MAPARLSCCICEIGRHGQVLGLQDEAFRPRCPRLRRSDLLRASQASALDAAVEFVAEPDSRRLAPAATRRDVFPLLPSRSFHKTGNVIRVGDTWSVSQVRAVPLLIV
jgi:hypothetical protein